MPEEKDNLFAAWFRSPLGELLAVTDQTRLHLLEFHDSDGGPALVKSIERRLGAPVVFESAPALDQIGAELETYFAGKSAEFRTPLATWGSDFERQIWSALRGIPLGETRSYLDIARAIGQPTAFRAVAQANHVNRIVILVPCHRVIGSDGSLLGYGAGIWRKKWLLRHEGQMRPVGLFAERS
jgi:AraC family transcriptional regulator, regulatory protein of adaptative response / methylated-DNA-[protein]-cysteine methyltransferase